MEQEGVICSHQTRFSLSVKKTLRKFPAYRTQASLPALTSVIKAEHENIDLENCKEKQAENSPKRIVGLLPVKLGPNRQKGRGSVPDHACPTQVTQVRCQRWPVSA